VLAADQPTTTARAAGEATALGESKASGALRAIDQAATSPQGRVAWIDLAKGLGIFLVALGHLTNGESTSVWLPALDSLHYSLYLFHMPLFFLLGGMVLRPRGRTLGAFAASRARGLLVSYYVFSLYFLAKPLLMVAVPGLAGAFWLSDDAIDLSQTLLNVLVMGEGLWFLWAYFWAELVAFVLVGWFNKHLDEGGAAVLEFIVGCVLVIGTQAFHIVYMDLRVPFQLLRGLWGAGYVLIGHALWQDVRDMRRGGALAFGAVCLIVFVLMDMRLRGQREPAMWGAVLFDESLGTSSGVVSLCAALLGSCAVIGLARAAERCAPIEAVGCESLACYALSPLVMNVCKLLLFSVAGVSLYDAPFVAQFACGIALAVASIALSLPLARLMRRHLPQLLGAKR
jgi:fucose 4-O-acetylase-like acetyltransferase